MGVKGENMCLHTVMEDRIWILLAKKISGEASSEELSELDKLMADNDKMDYTTAIAGRLWEISGGNKHNEELWDKIEAKIGSEALPVKKTAAGKVKWLAAAVVFILMGSAAMWYALVKKQPAIRQAASYLQTQPGSKSKLQLPDGTLVWLNMNSHLAFDNAQFGKERREVTLTGEAFFDVTKNEQVPFIIHAGSINIEVKGTAFNVKAYPQEKKIETSLVRGLIEITSQHDRSRKILLKPDEKIIISAPDNTSAKTDTDNNDGLLYTVTRLKKDDNEILPETVWMNNKLVFNNEPFNALAPKMEAWFNVTIHLMDESIEQARFSGVIEKETLEQTLEAMCYSYHFNYYIRGNEVWISKK